MNKSVKRTLAGVMTMAMIAGLPCTGLAAEKKESESASAKETAILAFLDHVDPDMNIIQKKMLVETISNVSAEDVVRLACGTVEAIKDEDFRVLVEEAADEAIEEAKKGAAGEVDVLLDQVGQAVIDITADDILKVTGTINKILESL